MDEFEEMAEEAQAEDAAEEVEATEEVVEEQVVEEPEEVVEEPRNDTVPLKTFLDEKSSRKDLQRQLMEMSEKTTSLEGQISDMVESNKPPPPDKEEDPFGYLDHGQQETQNSLKALQEQLRSATQESQAAQSMLRIQQLEADFASNNTDYFEAVEHLKQSRMEEYELAGYTDGQATTKLNTEISEIFQNAVQQGKNPAKVVYDLAKLRGAGGRGTVKETESLKELAAKQEGARTLSSSRGKSSNDENSIEDVNAMSDYEFDKVFTGQDGEKEFKKLFG